MKGYKLATWVGAAAIILAACGDDPVEPAVIKNDGGTGTQTMRVTADIDADDVPGGFVTDFDVSLRDPQGNAISGATVTIVNGTLGTINLLEDGVGSGDYTATRNTFAPGDYRLDVTKDADEVLGVIVGGIDQHSIVSPAAGDTLLANQAFMVTWSRTAQAAGADVETRDFVAEGVMTVRTSAPTSMNLRARYAALYAATPPVTPRTICRPANISYSSIGATTTLSS